MTWERLVTQAARLGLDQVPEPVATHAIRAVADTVGVMIAGGVRPVLRNTYGGLGLRDRPPGNGVLPGGSRRSRHGCACLSRSASSAHPRDVFPT